ncbi:MAG: hypothetical protein IKM08_08240 [Clostridia bacterium]|nr:hypothetical protein [Clostridia bacterium]
MNELEWERFAAAAREQHKDYDRRLRAVEDQQENLTTLIQSVATIAQKQVDMDSDIKEMKGDLKNITLKPAKRWESIVEKAILAAVGVLVAYVAVKIGMA